VIRFFPDYGSSGSARILALDAPDHAVRRRDSRSLAPEGPPFHRCFRLLQAYCTVRVTLPVVVRLPEVPVTVTV
jgi:hypothetical protein